MGIAVVSSYRGGANFEALGLSRTLVAEYFPSMASRISGIGMIGIQRRVLALHARAWSEDFVTLPVGGFYKFRKSGETHAWAAELIHMLQSAVASGILPDLQEVFGGGLQGAAGGDPRPARFRAGTGRQVAIDEVESITELRKRFVTPGMSSGALGPEAHGTLNIAMNRIGAKSDSGEGGEVSSRFKPRGQRRQRQLGDQADRLGALRRHGGISRQLPRDRDQGGARRQARRRRPAARPSR